jgi:hypothetical protein
MPLPPGARLGPYEIVVSVGAGGMGEHIVFRQYAAAKDGKRFLVNVPDRSTPTPPITVILNWPAAIKP